ncbi:MAG TPA: sugar transferase [Terriglobia bacterium]|nr:sugar transferase [Terriglobia bacterium]
MATLTTGLDKLISAGAVSVADCTSFYLRKGKRLFDTSGALVALIITSPLMLLCALLVRLTSRGPVLFRQTRVGRYGRPFTILKFRTLLEGSEALGSSLVLPCDPRLTPVGFFLRRTKLDELPQFVNVLRGDMSLVGPRPRVPTEVDATNPLDRILQGVRPGVTSYATAHHHMEADYCARYSDPQAAHRGLLPQKRSLDCEYLLNMSFLLDLKLLMLTLVLLYFPCRSPGTLECERGSVPADSILDRVLER